MRGVSWAGAIQALLIALTFARVWEDKFEYYHIPSEILYVVVPGGYFVLCWFIGYIDEMKGFWKMEGDYYNKKLNPMWEEWCEILDNTRVSRVAVHKMEEEIKTLTETVKLLEDKVYTTDR
jgi:hypothetical protein